MEEEPGAWMVTITTAGNTGVLPYPRGLPRSGGRATSPSFPLTPSGDELSHLQEHRAPDELLAALKPALEALKPVGDV